MGGCEGEQSDEDDSIPGPRKRKAKQLLLEDEDTQPLTVGTQPVEMVEDKESNDEDLFPGPRKKKCLETGKAATCSIRRKVQFKHSFSCHENTIDNKEKWPEMMESSGPSRDGE